MAMIFPIVEFPVRNIFMSEGNFSFSLVVIRGILVITSHGVQLFLLMGILVTAIRSILVCFNGESSDIPPPSPGRHWFKLRHIDFFLSF